MTCDHLLLASDATLERIAIPWLHVLNEHPSNLLKYSALFTKAPGGQLLGVRSALSQVRRWLKSRIRRNDSDGLPRQADVLFISHLLNESQIGASGDFYFGPLPELLMAQGISSCVALIDHTRAPHREKAGWSSDMAPRMLLVDTLTGGEEFTLRRRLQREARRLRAQSRQRKDARQGKILKEAARHAVSSSSIASLRMHQQILHLADRLRPRAIVVTYEGHAWERLAFAAARQIVPGIRCVGYHHTVLFPRQHAVLRLLESRRYDPDVVLTAGDISRDRFRRSFQGSGIHVATMGIHRRPVHAIDAEREQSYGNRASCLVIPDGIISEVVFLFDFAIESARQAPEVNFILRLHPVVSIENLKIQFPRFQQLPANVQFSTSTLDYDFSRSGWALYRGSNAAIYAVIAGVRPFYVEKPGEMSIDSLHDLGSWKRAVGKPDEFLKFARADLRDGLVPASGEAAAAADYCKRYFMPPDYRVFADAVGERVHLDQL